MEFDATHIIVGGGSAGCVLARRLSDRPAHRVILIEAGSDHPPGSEPADILSTFAGFAFSNPAYFWPDLKARRGDSGTIPPGARAPFRYEQAKLMGGGSSINSQTALRSASYDYDRWEELGATGWDWASVEPYFRKIENDIDFHGDDHGYDGPISVRRIPLSDWDQFSLSVNRSWADMGYRFLCDLNAAFVDGYGAIPTNNDGYKRISASIAYLNAETRRRPNLQILDQTLVRRMLINADRVTGVEIERADGTIAVLRSPVVIVAAGAIHSPALLMHSGIGPAARLKQLGITVSADRPNVGRNLLDHPMISLSAFLPPASRQKRIDRRSYSYLRYSSKEADCGPSDMVMMAASRSAWHALGAQIATLSAYVGQSFSKGSVTLVSADPHTEPDVCFNYLSDPRDFRRLVQAFLKMAETMKSPALAGHAIHPFPSILSDRVKKIGTPGLKNRLITDVAATLMDSATPICNWMIDRVIAEGPSLADLLADEDKLAEHIGGNVVTCYHPCGTCRMGNASDPMAVVDSTGLVVGLDNLYVADSSIMPDIPRNNINLPVIMIGEKLAEAIANR